jgi:hypothetical protein
MTNPNLCKACGGTGKSLTGYIIFLDKTKTEGVFFKDKSDFDFATGRRDADGFESAIADYIRSAYPFVAAKSIADRLRNYADGQPQHFRLDGRLSKMRSEGQQK